MPNEQSPLGYANAKLFLADGLLRLLVLQEV